MKNFDSWNNIKKDIDSRKSDIFFKKWQIWYISIWENIWFEQNGKWDLLLRPILIFQKFNNSLFYWTPLTRTKKEWKYYFEFSFDETRKSYAILSQMRAFDVKRLDRKIWFISKLDFSLLEEKIKTLLFEK